MSDYVEQIGDRSLQVVTRASAIVEVVRALGGTPSEGPDTWRISYDTEDQLGKILERLRDVNVAFAGGISGWPPAAVAELLRDRGKFHGSIIEVCWRGPGQEVVRQH